MCKLGRTQVYDIQVLGRKFLSTSYEMAKLGRAFIHSEGCAKCLGCELVGVIFEVQFSEGLFISFSLEFEICLLGKGLGTNWHGFSPPYIGERGLEQLAKCEGHHLSTVFLFCFVWCSLGRGLQQGMVVVYHLTCKVPYKMMEVVPQISNTWIVFTLPFSLSHSISPTI